MSDFLDQTGLSYFWLKIKALLNGKLGTSETAHKTASIPMGQVDSTSTATVFTATVEGITELRDGVCMWLKNGVVTSASGFTININNLGAKPVYSNLAAASRSTTIFNVNYTMLFVYNSTRVSGGCWDIVYGYDSNTIGYQVRHNSGTGKASAKTYRYRLLFTGDEDTLVPANTSSSTNATETRAVNQTPIDPFGAIYYYGSTSAVNANASFGAASLWQQYAISLGYSFNNVGNALTLAYPKAVYIKATPTSNGKAIIDADTPYVQTLPAVEDGKIYIYLGQAYSATNVELDLHHPVYEYKNGKIQLYTGNVIPTVTITPITGGHRITITDKDGEHSADVMDGTGNVNDVQINRKSIVDENGVANVPIGSSAILGAVRSGVSYGVGIWSDGQLRTFSASISEIKAANNDYKPIVPSKQHFSAFYGLAKAAGDTTQSQSSNAVGTYTDTAKGKIQTMLGVADLIGNSEGATASKAYSVGDVLLHDGKLYKVTASIAQGSAIVPNTNCTQTTIIDLLRGA